MQIVRERALRSLRKNLHAWFKKALLGHLKKGLLLRSLFLKKSLSA
jgi:hypothetical protein